MKRELNLVPKNYDTTKEKKSQTNAIVILALVLIISFGGSFGVMFGREFLLNRQKQSLEQELSKSIELINKDQELTNEINLIKSHIEKVKTFDVLKTVDTDGMIKELTAFFQSGAFALKSINYNMTRITIQGTASDKVEIQKAFASLRESEKFEKCHLNGYSNSDGGYAFTMEISVIGGATNVK